MKRKNWICLASAAVLTVALLPLPKQFLSADSAKSDDIVILYTNDVHCAVDTNIGYAGLALYQRELEAQYEHVFTVDAGDAIQGAPVGSSTKGKDIITLMNAVGYDVCIPGNHEFDYGIDCLLERSKELTCGYISCNIRNTEQDKTLFAPYQILEAGEKKIAFVGVTTPETFMSSTPAFFQNKDGDYIYSFSEQEDALIPCIQDSVDAARKENPDYVILLGHLGENGVKPQWSTPEVVSQLKGVDAVIDAHSHEEIPAEEVRDADGKTVIITQTGTKLQNIGKMTISGDGTIHTELIDTVPEPDKKLNLPEDSWQKLEKSGKYVDTAMQEKLDEINERLDETLSVKIGETAFKLYDSDPETGKRRVRVGETNLGNLCADAYREYLETDIAILNGGNVRSFIEPGDITYRQALSIMPFGNTISSAKVSGQQILDMLELGAMNYPEESGSFLHVSGMTYTIDPAVESTVKLNDKGEFIEVSGERRVHSVMIGGEPLEPDKTYTLATHDYYLKNGGDGYILSGKCELIRDGVISESEMFAAFIRDHLNGVIPERYREPYGEGRIRFDKLPEETTEPTETTEATEPAEATTAPAETTEPAADTTEPATEATNPTEPELPIPPELIAMLTQMGITEEQLMQLDWSKLPENPTMEDFQAFLTQQLSPGDQQPGDNGLPEGLDPSMFPEGFDYTKVDWSQFPAGFDWSQIPEDFDWFTLLEDDDEQKQQETQPMYVVPFSLTPRPLLTPTPVKEIEHKSYDYITSVPDTPASAPRRNAEDKDTPYTGETTAAGIAAAAAVLALLTASATRRKH